MASADVGIIGGSGLYRMPDLLDVETESVDTPFGAPSADLTVGTLSGVRVAFLPRHGIHHQYQPSTIPVRANIYALKSLGVRRIISVSAVGSMKEHLRPLDVVVPNQIFDRTVARVRTFFSDLTVHVALAEPYCGETRAAVVAAGRSVDATVHDGGTYICIEGPQFSSKAESTIYRSWGVDIIGMTAMPEARLAREAELCYATIALVTDYDVWHTTEEPVTVQLVLDNLRRNVATAQAILRQVLPALAEPPTCSCADALQLAIATPLDAIPPETRSRYQLLLQKYLT